MPPSLCLGADCFLDDGTAVRSLTKATPIVVISGKGYYPKLNDGFFCARDCAQSDKGETGD